ncbi:MAG: hypothetical protein PVJ57_21405 [Phycisphaerae bacterium]|jgi:hypothetical protein
MWLTVAASLFVSPALAEVSPMIFRVEASNASGSGAIEFTADELIYDPDNGTWHWTTGEHEIVDDFGVPIAMLYFASLEIREAPRIGGNFYLQAGTSLTTFEITLPQNSFPRLPADLTRGRAGLAVNITDLDGNGVTMRAVGPTGTGILRADYDGRAPDGTMFAQCLHEISVSSGTASGYQNVPAAGFLDIPDPVSDISTRLRFTLTANDYGEGLHFFEVQPSHVDQGDLNCDGNLGGFDVTPFVLVMTGTPPYYPEYYAFYPGCDHQLADLNGDGSINNFDVGPFVDVLTGR